MLAASHIVQLAVISLLSLALIVIQSASMRAGSAPASLGPMFATRHTAYALVAVLAMVIASRLDARQFQRLRGWRNPIWIMLGLSLVLVVLAMVPGLGKSVHGASRWLYLGPSSWQMSFQPSELVKWLMVIAIACWCSRRQTTMGNFRSGLLPPTALIAVACGLIIPQDLGTGVLIGLVATVMLWAGGARWLHLGALAIPGIMAVALAITSSPYRVDRLIAFVNPWRDASGIGYHPIQSMVAIAGGGLTGRGLGNGIQKFGYLPEDTTDFLFAVVCEELGLLGAALVVGLLLVLVWTCLHILRNCPDFFARLFILGVLLTVGFQALINIAVVTVVVPTKGIALPLLSAGGTGWILTAFSLGLVASFDVGRRYAPLATTPRCAHDYG